MKKTLCLILILWLPLFFQSAWAMSTHMLFDEAKLTTVHIAKKEQAHHCHQNTSLPKAHQSCSHCIYCALANATASFDAVPQISHVNLSEALPIWSSISYQSVSLPNSYKPPILN